MGGRHSGRAVFTALVFVGAVVSSGVAPSAAVAADSRPGSTTPEWARKIIGLLAYVPESYRTSCEIFDTTGDPTLAPFADHVETSLRCHPQSGADLVFYTEFDDVDVMDEAFDAYNPTEGDGSGDCPDTGTWDQDGVDAGRWMCYLSDKVPNVDEAAVVNWTHDASAILSNSVRFDDDSDALDAWWESDEAGPLPEPTSPGLPTAVATSAGWRRTAADIKRYDVPVAHRSSCRPLEVSPDGLGGPLYRRRIWLLGAVGCDAGGINNVNYYRFGGDSSSGPESPMEAFFRDQVDLHVDEEEPRVTERDIDCEGSGTWSQGGEERGEYACWYVGDGDTADYAAMEWTSTQDDILGYATSVDGRAAPLIEFWDDDAGPRRRPG